MKKIVKGNDFTLRIPVMKMVEGQLQAFPLPACTDVVVQVCNQFRRTPLAFEIDVKEDNVLLARVEGDKMSIGTYAIEVKGKIFGNDWRSNEYPQFAIVANNADADTEFGSTDEGDNSVEMDTAMVILPPSIELSDLIADTNKALDAVKETDKALTNNETLRVDAEGKRVLAESEREKAEKVRQSNEDERVKAENARKEQEKGRVSSEGDRAQAESERKEAESHRITNERERVNAETLRDNAEKLRVSQENERKGNEDVRKSDEDARIKAESERIKAETKREEDFSASKEAADNATEKALSTYSHPPYADSDGFYYKWNPDTQSYDKTDVNLKAQPSKPAFVFKSVEEMEATDINNFDLYDYVIINTDDTEDEDNAKLYLIDKNEDGAKYYHYLVDMSGFRGFTGKTPQISIGTITTLLPTEKASAAMTSDGMDEQGNPKYVINFAIPQGQKGDKGDSFSYADFTAEQIKELQKPATDVIATLDQTKVNCENATKAANDAASDATIAKTKAENAASGAEKCNVILEGSTISVTNRNGETKSVDVVNTDEEVTVTISSSVESIKVAGIKINVFLNNGKTPQSYTTNAEGKATFTVDRGNYYQVVFPEYGNAQPIAPQGYTAVLGSRNINVEYLPYDEDSMEKVIITATKYDDNVGTAWEDIPVIVTVDRKDTTYQTDAKGQVTVFVPYKKEYTVRIDNQDGYNVSFNKNSRTNTANVPQRLIDYRFYQFKAGIFVVDIDKNEYYIEDWVAAGKTADDAVAIKVADASLLVNHGTFCIRTSDIKNVSQLISKPWCTQNLQFDSIALNGNNVKDANYYNGESSSYLIRQEAQERSLSVPAFDYAYDQIFTIGGEELHGFVMSVGQEYVHVANIGIIKQVLETLYGEEVATNYYDFVMKKYRWTSTQSSATDACYYSSSATNHVKWHSIVVLPVYAC